MKRRDGIIVAIFLLTGTQHFHTVHPDEHYQQLLLEIFEGVLGIWKFFFLGSNADQSERKTGSARYLLRNKRAAQLIEHWVREGMKLCGRVLWRGILAKYSDRVFWRGILYGEVSYMARYSGKVFWQSILARYSGKILAGYCGELLWQSIVARYSGRVFW
jgi:hypothetical protein